MVDISGLDTKLDSVLVDTGTDIPDLIGALENISAAEVKAEMIAVLNADVTTEPLSVPTSTAPLSEKLSYLFAFAANELRQTSSLQTVRNSANTADISTANVTTNGVTTTRGEHS